MDKKTVARPDSRLPTAQPRLACIYPSFAPPLRKDTYIRTSILWSYVGKAGNPFSLSLFKPYPSPTYIPKTRNLYEVQTMQDIPRVRESLSHSNSMTRTQSLNLGSWYAVWEWKTHRSHWEIDFLSSRSFSCFHKLNLDLQAKPNQENKTNTVAIDHITREREARGGGTHPYFRAHPRRW